MSAAITLWSKQMTKSLRNQMEMSGMLIQPVLWVVLFGVGMGSLLGPSVPGGEDFYITFMLPGMEGPNKLPIPTPKRTTHNMGWINMPVISI